MTSPLGIAFTRYFTEYIAKDELGGLVFVFSRIVKILVQIALVVFLLCLVISSWVANFIKTKTIYMAICGVTVSFTILLWPLPSLAEGFQKFKINSYAFFAASFGKLIIGGVLIYLKWGIVGGLIGYLTAHSLSILVPFLFLRRFLDTEVDVANKENKKSTIISLRPIFMYCFPAFMAMLSFGLLTNVDVIFMKHFFSSLQAYDYGIAQTMGRVVLVASGTLVTVIFPKATDAFIQNRSPLKILHKALCLTGCGCLLLILICFQFSDSIAEIIAGSPNQLSNALIPLFSLAMSFYALLSVTVSFALATHNLTFLKPLFILAICETLSIYWYHPTLTAVLYLMLIFSVISFATSSVIISSRRNSRLATV